jgi:hypothetical protein
MMYFTIWGVWDKGYTNLAILSISAEVATLFEIGWILEKLFSARML